MKVEVTTPVEENIAAEMKENGQITDTLLENEEFKKRMMMWSMRRNKSAIYGLILRRRNDQNGDRCYEEEGVSSLLYEISYGSADL